MLANNSVKLFNVVIAINLLLFSCCCFAQKQDLDSVVLEEVQQRIKHGIYVGLVVGVVDSSGERYYSFGKKSLVDSAKPDENTVFPVGSISKTFVATLLADMNRREVVSYQIPVQKILPKGVIVPIRGNKEITPWALITHTSGLPGKPDNVTSEELASGYLSYTSKKAYSALLHTELLFDSGSQFSYSSFGTGLLALALSHAAGKDYESLMQERVFSVLSMHDTSTVLTPRLQKNLAYGYENHFPTVMHVNMIFQDIGSVKSTAKDMLRYLSANMALLETPLESVLNTLHVPRVDEGISNNIKQGLGWWVLTEDGKEFIMHNGIVSGYRASAIFNKKDKRGVIVLANSDGMVEDVAMRIMVPGRNIWHLDQPLSIALLKKIQEGSVFTAIEYFKALPSEKLDTYWKNENGLNNLGFHYLDDGEFDSGISLLKYAADLLPNSANLLDSIAYSYAKAGNTKNAFVYYQKLSVVDPGFPGVLRNIERFRAK